MSMAEVADGVRCAGWPASMNSWFGASFIAQHYEGYS
jgi:hypothetical protein